MSEVLRNATWCHPLCAQDHLDIVSAIEAAAPEVEGRVTFDDVQLPFPEEMEAGGLEDVVGPIEWTTLLEGTRLTIELYRARVSA
jgi:hypothetical protein